MSRILSAKERKEELNRALKSWKLMACMLGTGLISSWINPVWTPIGMLIGFAVSFIYYILIKKGE